MYQAQENKVIDERKQDEDLTFQPQIFTNMQKKFSGSAGLLTKTAGENHIQRQAKARKEKSAQHEGFLRREPALAAKKKELSRMQESLRLPSEMPTSLSLEGDNLGDLHFQATRSIRLISSLLPRYHTASIIPYDSSSAIDISKFVKGFDEYINSNEDEDVVAIELLERERREWRIERMRYILCT